LTDEAEADHVVHLIAANWRQAPLAAVDQALCAYAEKLTQTPHQMTESDLETLRQHGLDDRAIHDATQVISYFNYINRIADSLHVEPEDFIRPWEKQHMPKSSVPLRQRLKADLLGAMKARQNHVVSTLRSTLAEIDNAEAVEVDTSFVPMADRTNDVPRKVLTEAEIRAILQSEADQIKLALAEYERVGRVEKAAELQAAWEVLAGYLADV
jgi:uncharacterized protein YqeY